MSSTPIAELKDGVRANITGVIRDATMRLVNETSPCFSFYIEDKSNASVRCTAWDDAAGHFERAVTNGMTVDIKNVQPKTRRDVLEIKLYPDTALMQCATPMEIEKKFTMISNATGDVIRIVAAVVNVEDVGTTSTSKPMRRITVADQTGEASVVLLNEEAEVTRTMGEIVKVVGKRGSKTSTLTILANSIEPARDPSIEAWISTQDISAMSSKRARGADALPCTLREVAQKESGEKVQLVCKITSMSPVPTKIGETREKHNLVVVDVSGVTAQLAIFCNSDETVDVKLNDAIATVATVSSYDGKSLTCNKVTRKDDDEALNTWWEAHKSDTFDELKLVSAAHAAK